MLFVLDDSLLEFIERDPANLQLVNSIELLALAHREGKHILSGSRNILDSILKKSPLSHPTYAMLTRIKTELPQFGLFHQVVNRYVRIVFEALMHRSDEDGRRIIYISYTKFQDSSIIQKTLLVTENKMDADLYLLFAAIFTRCSKLHSFQIAATPRGGGGSTIGAEYKFIQDEEIGFCLCIADSDQKAPETEYGNVARNLLLSDNQYKPMTEAIPTTVRMIENYLSTKQLSLAATMDAQRMAAVSFLETTESMGVVELRKYINLKEGIKLSDVYKLPLGNPVREFVHTELKKLLEKNMITTRTCIEGDTCNRESSCVCELMPGFGNTILKDTLDILSKMSLQKLDETLCEISRPEWIAIGRIVFSWCCARTRVNT